MGDTRQIRVRLSNLTQKIQLPGFKVEDECLITEVPRSMIPEIIQTLNNLNGVEDVQIEDPPLESLIRKFTRRVAYEKIPSLCFCKR